MKLHQAASNRTWQEERVLGRGGGGGGGWGGGGGGGVDRGKTTLTTHIDAAEITWIPTFFQCDASAPPSLCSEANEANESVSLFNLFVTPLSFYILHFVLSGSACLCNFSFRNCIPVDVKLMENTQMRFLHFAEEHQDSEGAKTLLGYIETPTNLHTSAVVCCGLQ